MCVSRRCARAHSDVLYAQAAACVCTNGSEYNRLRDGRIQLRYTMPEGPGRQTEIERGFGNEYHYTHTEQE